MNEALETNPVAKEPFFKKYKLPLSVAAAVLIVAAGAMSHYKNERVKEELIQSLSAYQKDLVLVGGELHYDALECSGILSTNCEIEGIKLSLMGQEQLSVEHLRLGDVEEFGELKKLSAGQAADASIDIEAQGVALPRILLAQMIAQNVSNAFQQNTLEKLSRVNLEFKGEVESDGTMMKRIEVTRLGIDNEIMPIAFSMEARDISPSAPDSMILEAFELSIEDRAVSDVTYESVKSFADTLSQTDKEALLAGFGLKTADMNDKTKASAAINTAMAKRFEADLANTPGVVEKELIRAIIQLLKGEASEIVLQGKNKNDMTIAQVQTALLQSSTMSEAAAEKFMDDKFTIQVKAE